MTHDGYMCDGVCVRARFILIGLSVRVAFYAFALRALAWSLAHVDHLAFTGKDVHPQTQVVVLVASEVQPNVAVRTLRGIHVRFVRKAQIVRVELLSD